jgi:hypothetical protein
LGGFMDAHRPQQAQVGAFSAQMNSSSIRCAASAQSGTLYAGHYQDA